MRFTTTASALRDSLASVRGVIPSSPSLLAFSGVQLSADASGVVRVSGSDGETSLVVAIPATDVGAGHVLLQPRPLATFLATLPAATSVHLEADGQGDVTVSPSGFSPYQFRPLAATFPAPPTVAGTPRECSLDDLAAVLSAIRPAIPRDTHAVQVVSTADGVALSTTDTFRLAQGRLATGFGDFSGVLSATVLDKVARMAPTSVVVDGRGRMVSFASADVTMTARLLSVPFPAVESVIESKPPFSVTFDPRALRAAITRLAAVADQAAVRLRLEGSLLRLEASTADIGAGAEELPIGSPVAAPFEVLVKAQYIQDVANAFDTSVASLSYSGALQPLYVSAEEPVSLLHVVMPVRS